MRSGHLLWGSVVDVHGLVGKEWGRGLRGLVTRSSRGVRLQRLTRLPQRSGGWSYVRV